MQADLSLVVTVFEEMQRDGLDILRPMQWGYFFTSRDRKVLDALLPELVRQGFTEESIHRVDRKQWVLQVSRTEALSAEALHARNLAFNALAESFQVDEYDGWDVTPLMQ